MKTVLGQTVIRVLILGFLPVTSIGAHSESLIGTQTAPDPALTHPDTGHAMSRTAGLSGLTEPLAKRGIDVALGSTNIYQTNIRNGLDTHGRSGRFSGSYDVEIAADLQALAGLKGLSLFVHAEGGWPDTEGINESMVGSAFGVNADALGNRSIDVVEALVEWSLFRDRLTLTAGKVDTTCFFDTSEFANDETIQFLNGALVNNPTIPLPDYGLGVILSARLTDRWTVTAGAVDAEADGRETGFRTTFGGEDYFFYALETGLTTEWDSAGSPLTGNYRLGLWYDPQPKAHADRDQEHRDDVGLYVSVDQMLLWENDDPEDSQGLGLFARYGYADEKRNDVVGFWSVGLQYQGLLEGRDSDVFALGFAQGVFSDAASAVFTADHENVLELYYSAPIIPGLILSPSIQYLSRPGGNCAVDDALVVGLRVQAIF